MANIKNTQDDFIIELTLNEDITNDTVVIKYTDPSGVSGQWVTTITNAISGIVQYINPLGIFLEVGTYKIYAHVTRQNGKVIIGDTANFSVVSEGF